MQSIVLTRVYDTIHAQKAGYKLSEKRKQLQLWASQRWELWLSLQLVVEWVYLMRVGWNYVELGFRICALLITVILNIHPAKSTLQLGLTTFISMFLKA
jgi:hypothetical protein